MEDHEILKRVRREDQKNFGFKLLVNKYQQQVYTIIRKMVIDHHLADDLVQETFIQVFRSIDQFRGEASLYTWIYRIAVNKALAAVKKEKRRALFSLTSYQEKMVMQIEQDPMISADDIQRKLQKAILKLPERQKLIFNLKYYEDLSYADMAEITGLSIGGLKSTYHLAVKKIENFLLND